MRHHGEKNRTKHEEDESKLNIYTIKNLLSFPTKVNNLSSEIKSLQRSLALMKQDLPKILRDELIRLNGEGY